MNVTIAEHGDGERIDVVADREAELAELAERCTNRR